MTTRTFSGPLAAFAEALEQASPADCPALLGELERLKAQLWHRLVSPLPSTAAREADRLLTVDEVAQRLNLTKDYVYRHAKQYPFTVREGRHIRFSEAGLARYLRQRQAR